MLLFKSLEIKTIADAQSRLQTAIALEFSTLPPYLYASFSIPQGKNAAAFARIRAIQGQEMIHMCLACNILNAIGGAPVLKVPTYPGYLPGDIGHDGVRLKAHLYPFGKEAIAQGAAIEEPVHPIVFRSMMLAATPTTETIGQFYERLKAFLKTLPASDWTPNHNQLVDTQFMAGQIFAVNTYADAARAIDIIVSEGEGSSDDPLDFQKEVSHYYRFEEILRNQVLTKAPGAPNGFVWGAPLGVVWEDVYPAITDPGAHDFSKEPPAAQAAQTACNVAFTAMVDALQLAVTGQPDQLGIAIRHMYELRMAALHALQTPLADGKHVAGPAFLYLAKH